MKILVIGRTGFIGGGVSRALEGAHEVFGTTTNLRDAGSKDIVVDLLKPETLSEALITLRPDVIVNCAGIVENSSKAKQNPVFTSNLLETAASSGLEFKRIIISGSAAEYGLVELSDIPVKETVARRATGDYAVSKVEEVDAALRLGKKYGLPVTIARIFNPIGAGMHPRFLIPSLARQVQDIKNGVSDAITVSRLNSKRDYIDVSDVGFGVRAIIENQPSHSVYNVGSGISTSNEELLNLVLSYEKLDGKPRIVETLEKDEPLVAIQADISLMRDEFGWKPAKSVRQSVKEIIGD